MRCRCLCMRCFPSLDFGHPVCTLLVLLRSFGNRNEQSREKRKPCWKSRPLRGSVHLLTSDDICCWSCFSKRGSVLGVLCHVRSCDACDHRCQLGAAIGETGDVLMGFKSSFTLFWRLRIRCNPDVYPWCSPCLSVYSSKDCYVKISPNVWL